MSRSLRIRHHLGRDVQKSRPRPASKGVGATPSVEPWSGSLWLHPLLGCWSLATSKNHQWSENGQPQECPEKKKTTWHGESYGLRDPCKWEVAAWQTKSVHPTSHPEQYTSTWYFSWISGGFPKLAQWELLSKWTLSQSWAKKLHTASPWGICHQPQDTKLLGKPHIPKRKAWSIGDHHPNFGWNITTAGNIQPYPLFGLGKDIMYRSHHGVFVYLSISRWLPKITM